MTRHRIIIGDCREMHDVANESVHLVVTSPPYWQLKDYGSAEQIGYHDSYEEYINHLNLVWQECGRVLCIQDAVCASTSAINSPGRHTMAGIRLCRFAQKSSNSAKP